MCRKYLHAEDYVQVSAICHIFSCAVIIPCFISQILWTIIITLGGLIKTIHFAHYNFAVWVLVYWWWQFDWSFARLIAPVVTTISFILSSNRIRNGNILVLANPGPSRKWPLKWRERVEQNDFHQMLRRFTIQDMIFKCLLHVLNINL